MNNKFLKNLLKIGALVLVLFAAFHIADVAFASEHVAEPLAKGGAGLGIPKGEVEISADIAQRPLRDVVLAMVNYFIGFLGFIAVIVSSMSFRASSLRAWVSPPLTPPKAPVPWISQLLVSPLHT